MEFAGQVTWITGASSRIGEALARAFAARGARRVLSARREPELARVAEACRAADGAALAGRLRERQSAD